MAAKPPDPVSHDDHDDKASSQPTFQWSGTGQEPLDDAESSADEADIGNSTKTFPPVQKRRRVTRACDECRRKKIKCDGKQPCTHCTVYSYGQWLYLPMAPNFSELVKT